jgi:CO/xanthine dehydrogenase Mo-binding subunit
LTSAVATIAAVSVNRKDGTVSVLNHHTIVECGRIMVPQLATGQVRGATAMGIGVALFEELPLYDDGPGAGDWNLDRYRLPRMEDVAPWRQSVEFLPALSETDPPKGFSEAAIIPIAPAIGNAIAHACGKRLYQFPMTPSRVKEILS